MDEHDDAPDSMAFVVEADGLVRLSWRQGVAISGELAERAMRRVDELNGDTEHPLLVVMRGTGSLSREARMVFARRCTASRIALLGSSAVDRVLANFALGVRSQPVPTRFFTDEDLALGWLRG
ncbi:MULTISPECIES: hypothetical protein [Pseudonocardia]|uniref:DUF7793 domain-containing protein n=1 Tax=Pseudonocardia oroxyli TaxID=366584 RepID=A0A1G7Z3B6_PSEOR|nr:MULTISPECIES: hypothetical protein [Pseudonocardia]MCF7547410.1 hypothetical protein [Pseudonocardia sp. WMMC193]MCF7553890.1 hypothetical protein [Pseudonocardia sp. WMMC193]MCF7553919.1 hypothetical protein [Pseudonocardia sp. WMMC193]MCF7553947.1 hypothetical protein [Pseudonocardia sp. WMMC193]SDH03261.1 hypothetical protein SAMN05216377_11822 [Pseudonocardia oroxyli]